MRDPTKDERAFLRLESDVLDKLDFGNIIETFKNTKQRSMP